MLVPIQLLFHITRALLYYVTNCLKYFRHMTNEAYNSIFYLVGLLIFFRLNVEIVNVFTCHKISYCPLQYFSLHFFFMTGLSELTSITGCL